MCCWYSRQQPGWRWRGGYHPAGKYSNESDVVTPCPIALDFTGVPTKDYTPRSHCCTVKRAEWMALQVIIVAKQRDNGHVVTHDLVDAVMSRDADTEQGKASKETVRRIIRKRADSEGVRVIFTPEERYWAIREQLHQMSRDKLDALVDSITEGGDDDPRGWDIVLINALSVARSNRQSPSRLWSCKPVSIRLWQEPISPADAAPAAAEEGPATPGDSTCPTEARFGAYAAYEAAVHAALSLTPQSLNDLSFALNRLVGTHPDEAVDGPLVDAVSAVCDAWVALEDANDLASRISARRAAREAVTQTRTAILAFHPHAARMHGMDMPAIAVDIRAAACGYNGATSTPEELSVMESGTPTVRVHCRSDSGSGWTVTATITAGIDSPAGYYPAHPPIVVQFRRRDGRQDPAINARHVLGPRLRVDVPVNYTTPLPLPPVDLVWGPDEREEWHVIRHDGQHVAIADVQDIGDGVWIHSISVHPGYRGRGYGSSILASVIARHGADIIALSCRAFVTDFPGVGDAVSLSNEDLTAWYERHGFRPDPDDTGGEHRMIRRPAE